MAPTGEEGREEGRDGRRGRGRQGARGTHNQLTIRREWWVGTLDWKVGGALLGSLFAEQIPGSRRAKCVWDCSGSSGSSSGSSGNSSSSSGCNNSSSRLGGYERFRPSHKHPRILHGQYTTPNRAGSLLCAGMGGRLTGRRAGGSLAGRPWRDGASCSLFHWNHLASGLCLEQAASGRALEDKTAPVCVLQSHGGSHTQVAVALGLANGGV